MARSHDPRRQMMDFGQRPELHVHIENKPVVQVSNQVQNNTTQDFAELTRRLEQLDAGIKEQLRAFVAALPEPENPEEKTTFGKSILNWLNKNAEGITMNVASSVYYDVVKAALLG